MLGWFQGLALALAGLVLVWSVLLIFLYLIQRNKAKQQEKIGPLKKLPSISLCIAFRNESENLPKLLCSLQNQTYPSEFFEIIFVDDHSEDNSRQIIEQWESRFSVQVVSLNAGEQGKKAALHVAIQTAKGAWIMSTDADCHFGPEWISTMVQLTIESRTEMVCGPVILQGSSMFSTWEALEFSSLVASAASAIHVGRPTFCNAANLLYQKNTYENFHRNRTDNHLPGGDDVFLMHHIHEMGGSIEFALSKNSLVFSKTQGNWKSFENQRIRWASKVFSGLKGSNFSLAAILWIFHLLFLIYLPIGIWLFPAFSMAILFFKMGTEAIYLFDFQPNKSKLKHLWNVACMQVPYAFYVIYFGLRIRKSGGFQWKGRDY